MLRPLLVAACAIALFACSSQPAPQPTPAPTPTEPAPAEPTPTEPTPTEPDLTGQGQPCPEGGCAAGLECVRYYGIAGPSGPELTSCEIRCGEGTGCPAGQDCVTIADGPGQVCRAP